MKNLIALLCLSASLQIAVAQNDPISQALYEPDLIMKFRNEISLTDEQLQTIAEIYQQKNNIFTEKRKRWSTEMEVFQNTMQDGRIDAQEADKALQEVLVLESEIKRLRLSSLVEIKNVLSLAQQQKLDDIKKTHPEFTKAFELHFGTNGTKMTIQQSKPESVTAKQEKATYYLIGDGLKKAIEFRNLNDIAQGDIESISVFKGETAVEKYGPSGKDGVVEIRLKKTAIKKYSEN